VSFAKRFIGVENLPTRLSEFDVQQSFCLSKEDIAAVSERFRHDRRVAAAIQMLFLRASGRPLDRFASVPKTLLHSVCDALATPVVSIASLRSLYLRRSQDLFRRAAERVQKGRSRHNGLMLQQALKAKSVLHEEAKSWRDRVLEARAPVGRHRRRRHHDLRLAGPQGSGRRQPSRSCPPCGLARHRVRRNIR